MKTTKIIALLFLSTSIQNNSFAQGLYFEVNSGYSLSAGSQNISTNSSYNYDGVSNTSKDENIVGSFGKGFEIGFKVGYKFSDNFSIDVKTSQLFGAKYTSENSSTMGYSNEFESYSSTDKSSDVMQGKMLNINPAMVFELGQSKFKPYTRIGVVIGMGQIDFEYISSSKETYTDMFGEASSYNSTTAVEGKMYGGFALGASAEIGINLGLTEKLSFNAGLKMVAMSFAPTRGEITKYEEDGIDLLSTLNTNDREAEFVDEISDNGSSATDINKPSKGLKEYYSFSNVGLSIGFKFSL